MIYPSPTLYPGNTDAYPSWESPTSDHIFTYAGGALATYGGTTTWTYAPETG